MDEEAGFIAAMHAEPTDRTVLLVYADWLDERNDPRGQYLRLLVADEPDRDQLQQLCLTLDPWWLNRIANRHCRLGSTVRILCHPFVNLQGELVAITPNWWLGTVRTVILGGPADIEVPLVTLARA